jgi:hypothetical protein
MTPVSMVVFLALALLAAPLAAGAQQLGKLRSARLETSTHSHE